MRRIYQLAKFILLVTTLSLAACQSESSSSDSLQASTPPPAKAAERSQAADLKADYDFDRQLQSCVGAVCTLVPAQKMKMLNYSPALIADMGLTTSDTLATARAKLSAFYPGTISSGLSNTTKPKLKLLSAQMSPGHQDTLSEYDIVIRTEGMSNGAQVHDWGARIRCAPVTANTLWQTVPCKL